MKGSPTRGSSYGKILSPAPGANCQGLPAACTLRVLSGLRMLAPDAHRDQPDRERCRPSLRDLPESVLAIRGHALRAGGRGSAEGHREMKDAGALAPEG